MDQWWGYNIRNFCAISSLIGANAIQRGCAYQAAALLAKRFGSCDPGRFWGSCGWTLQSEVAVGPAGRLKKGLSLENIRDSEIAMENDHDTANCVMKYAPLCGHCGSESI